MDFASLWQFSYILQPLPSHITGDGKRKTTILQQKSNLRQAIEAGYYFYNTLLFHFILDPSKEGFFVCLLFVQ